MSQEEKSTEEAQADATAEATADTTKQDTSDATAEPDTGTGMIAPQPDSELAATGSSQDTPVSELKPLFDETAPSEAELSGAVEEEKAATETKEDKAEGAEGAEKSTEKEKEEEKAPAEGAAKEETAEEKEAREKAEAEKPPAGYVPHAALHEERMMRQQLGQEVAELRQKLEDSEKPEEEAFKVLSDKEFDELAEDDPVEAVKYERKLNEHLRNQTTKEAGREAEKAQYYQDQALINKSIENMEKAVPGLHEEGNTINRDLGDFAVENGFDPDYLKAMTSPSTLILPPGAKNAVLLGDGAAGLVGMIHKLRSASKENDPVALRAKIKAETETELRKTITEELMKKFKSLKPEEFKSIGEVPGASDEIPSTSGGITEAQYANMSPAQRDKLLGA